MSAVEELSTDGFPKWVADAVDQIDATLFSGDSFVGTSSHNFDRRAMLREYCERWKRQLDIEDANAHEDMKSGALECNACSGSGRVIRDQDIGTDRECWVCDGSGKAE